jgi:hypothetical protein
MKDNTESPVVFDIAAALAELAALTDDIERLGGRLDHFEKTIEAWHDDKARTFQQ